MAVMVAHTGKEPPRASKACPSLPSALDAPILAMLAKDQQARPSSVGAAIEAVVKAAESAGVVITGAPVRPVEARRPVSGPQEARPSTGGGATPPAAPQARVQATPMTPTDMSALAEATTLAQSEPASPKTLLDSESDVVPRAASRWRGVLFGALALTVGAAALAVAAWSGPRAPRQQSASEEAPASSFAVPASTEAATATAIEVNPAPAGEPTVAAPALSATPPSSAAASASARVAAPLPSARAPVAPGRPNTPRPGTSASRELEVPTY